VSGIAGCMGATSVAVDPASITGQHCPENEAAPFVTMAIRLAINLDEPVKEVRACAPLQASDFGQRTLLGVGSETVDVSRVCNLVSHMQRCIDQIATGAGMEYNARVCC